MDGPKRLQRNSNFFKKTDSFESTAAVVEKKIKQARGTGTLNLTGTGFEVLTSDLFRTLHSDESKTKKTRDDDFQWWMVSELKEIRLSHNSLKDIEDGCLNGLLIQVLLLDNNLLDRIPPAVWDLHEHLKKLVCSKNNLQQLQVDVQLSNLVVLELSHNKLQSIPEIAHYMPNLTIMDVRHNNLQLFPSILPNQLVALYVANNALARLSHETFKHLERLETLDISHNRLESFPNELSYLHSLKFLDLRYNQLGFNRLNGVLGLNMFRSLTTFDIRDNKLEKVPQGALSLSNLKILEISNNDIVELPYALGYMTTLQIIKIEGNRIRTIRRGIIEAGTERLKEYLRSRDPNPNSNQDVEQKSSPPSISHRLLPKDSLPNHTRAEISNKAIEKIPKAQVKESVESQSTYHADTANENHRINSLSSNMNQTRNFPSSTSHLHPIQQPENLQIDHDVLQLKQSIASLEDILENDFSLTGTRKNAIKRQLANERSRLASILPSCNHHYG